MISLKQLHLSCMAIVVLVGLVPLPAGANDSDKSVAQSVALIESGQTGKLSQADWIEALQSEDRLLREAAVSLALRGGGDAFIPSPENMASLTAETRTQLLSVLGMRGNSAALPAIRPSLRAEDASERTAAVLAVGELGDTASSDILIELALSDDPAAETARGALPRLAETGIDRQLMTVFLEGLPEQQERALEVLAVRGQRAVVPILLTSDWLRDRERSKAAAEALGALGTDEDFTTLLEESIELSGSTRTNLNRALARIVLTSDYPQQLLALLRSRIAREDMATQMSYIALHGQMQGKAAIEALLGFVRDPNPDIAKRAIITLGAWDDEGAVDPLVELVYSNDPLLKETSLRALSILLERHRWLRNSDLGKRIEAIIASNSPASTSEDGEWVPLFNGRDLDGWTVRSGFADYRVEDDSIVGTTAAGSPNTFLCTEREFSDFILEFEVLCDRGLNSGVQFRSNAYSEETEVRMERNGKSIVRKMPADRVYGYQVEIAANNNAGRIYDEARRGTWLDSGPPASLEQPVFKPDDWNHYRVVVLGDYIQTFVNGVKIADFHDSVTASGFIGLQVHGIREGQGPFSVRWRNLKIKELDAPFSAAGAG